EPGTAPTTAGASPVATSRTTTAGARDLTICATVGGGGGGGAVAQNTAALASHAPCTSRRARHAICSASRVSGSDGPTPGGPGIRRIGGATALRWTPTTAAVRTIEPCSWR